MPSSTIFPLSFEKIIFNSLYDNNTFFMKTLFEKFKQEIEKIG